MYINKSYIIYPSFIIAVLLLIVVFVTSTSYTQLGVSVLVYPILAFLGYKIFIDRHNEPDTIAKTISPQTAASEDIKEQTSTSTTKGVTVSDIDKRAFIKLLGATGISFFLISVFGQRIQSLFFGGSGLSQSATPAGSVQTVAAASPTDGYNIAEVDDSEVSYSGFINKDGAWYIMKGDNNNGSFRFTRGKSDFPGNWHKRQNLQYSYFHQVFP